MLLLLPPTPQVASRPVGHAETLLLHSGGQSVPPSQQNASTCPRRSILAAPLPLLEAGVVSTATCQAWTRKHEPCIFSWGDASRRHGDVLECSAGEKEAQLWWPLRGVMIPQQPGASGG